MTEDDRSAVKKGEIAVPAEIIEQKIYLIRGQKVMLDFHLADLYLVETRKLTQAVKRNIDRFPTDFMFRISKAEFNNLRSQIVISKQWGGRRHLPYAFTEQGVAMLSSVLRSKRAIQVNIAIMRAFVRLRNILAAHEDLKKKLEDLERRFEKHDGQIKLVFDAIRQLMQPPESPKRKIGFHAGEKKMNYGTD